MRWFAKLATLGLATLGQPSSAEVCLSASDGMDCFVVVTGWDTLESIGLTYFEQRETVTLAFRPGRQMSSAEDQLLEPDKPVAHIAWYLVAQTSALDMETAIDDAGREELRRYALSFSDGVRKAVCGPRPVRFDAGEPGEVGFLRAGGVMEVSVNLHLVGPNGMQLGIEEIALATLDTCEAD
jgi:hypothetical protein